MLFHHAVSSLVSIARCCHFFFRFFFLFLWCSLFIFLCICFAMCKRVFVSVLASTLHVENKTKKKTKKTSLLSFWLFFLLSQQLRFLFHSNFVGFFLGSLRRKRSRTKTTFKWFSKNDAFDDAHIPRHIDFYCTLARASFLSFFFCVQKQKRCVNCSWA